MGRLPTVRRELTVTLERKGDEFSRSYSWGPYRGLHPSTARWSDVAGFVDEVNAILDRGERSELSEKFAGSQQEAVGEQLFALLFGAPGDWEPVFRGLFDQVDGSAPSPVRGAIRMRIETTDPDLLGLPFRLTCWAGFVLAAGHDWTFEVAVPGVARPQVHVAAPLKVLVLAPRYPDGPRTDDHVADLQAFLGRVSPLYLDAARECFCRVRTRKDLEEMVDRLRPDLLYYNGLGSLTKGQLSLELDGGELLSAAELALLLAKRPPSVVYLNGCVTGASGQQSAGHQLSARVPLVIVNRTSVWSTFAHDTALEWLKAWLVDGSDPIVAIHSIRDSALLHDFQWFGPATHASYATWKTDPHLPRIAPKLGSLGLDRKPQRDPTLGRLTEVIESKTQRGAVIFGYAAPGNLLSRHGEQLLTHIIERANHLASPLRIALEIPKPGDRDGLIQLRDTFRLQLRARAGESMTDLLRRWAPGSDSSRRTPLLWLDWGCLEGEELLRESELAAWFDFCGNVLPGNCPHDIRLVSYLAMEVPARKLKKLAGDLRERRRQSINPYCAFVDCPPLDIVNFDDLYEHLNKPDLTLCPPALAKAVAEAIERKTGGQYEATVAMLDQGGNLGWQRLLDRLKGTPAATEAPESEDGYQ